MIYLENQIRNLGNFAKRGKENPITGTHFTKEHKDKIRTAMIGRKIIWKDKISKSKKGKPNYKLRGIPIRKEIKDKLRKLALAPERLKKSISNLPKDCRGEKNGNYKGGIKYFEEKWGKYKHYNKLKEYKKWRLRVFERDNFTCVNCGKVGGYLEAHHIKSYTKHPKLRFVVSNGVTLCRNCHILTRKKN